MSGTMCKLAFAVLWFAATAHAKLALYPLPTLPSYTSKEHPDKEYPEIQKAIEAKYGIANYYKSLDKCDPAGSGYTSWGKCPGYFRMCKSFLQLSDKECETNALESNCSAVAPRSADIKSPGKVADSIDCKNTKNPDFGKDVPDTPFFTISTEIGVWEDLGYFNPKKCASVEESSEIWCKHIYWSTQWCPGHITGASTRRLTLPCQEVCYQLYMNCKVFQTTGLEMPTVFKIEPESYLKTLSGPQLIWLQCYLFHPEAKSRNQICHDHDYYYPDGGSAVVTGGPTSSETSGVRIFSVVASVVLQIIFVLSF